MRVPKILYLGEISKYELWMLRILSRAGCDIAYVHYENEDSYLKIDRDSLFSTPVYGAIKKAPSQSIDQPAAFQQPAAPQQPVPKRVNNNIPQAKSLVHTNTWMNQSALESLFLINSSRGGAMSDQIFNLFVRYIGVDSEDEYHNRLFHFHEKLKQSAKQYVLITQKIENPTLNETNRIKRPAFSNSADLINGLALQLTLTKNKTQNSLIQQGFIQTMERIGGANLSKLFNQGVQLICWLLRYGVDLFAKFDPEQPPAVIYYGICSAKEADFLCMLSLMGMDVVMVCPDKIGDAAFAQNSLAKESVLEELPESQPVKPFPQMELKVRMATAAYAAERDLEQMLYTDDTGMFKNRQFKRSNPVTLKTTLDELYILWKQPAKFRPSFQTENNRVTVPNIFAKICGVPDRNTPQYLDKICTMMTQNSLFIRQFPYIMPQDYNQKRHYVSQCLRGGSILPDMVKQSPLYQYDYINQDTQDYMLEKMQELIQLNWVQCGRENPAEIILLTLLHINRPVLHLIQSFDFTGNIPKIIILSTNESMCSLQDCIFLSFLNLIGFDIVVFTPTGYSNIEKYIRADVYEEYTSGDFVFDMAVPSSMTPKEEGNDAGFFGRLFNKRRN